MFHQLLTPVADSLPLSFFCALLPIITVFVMLGIFRRPAWQSSLTGLAVALVVAVTLWKLPVGLALDSVAAGATFALWPVMWIVFAALLLYNIAVVSGNFDQFKAWMVSQMPNDRRVVLVVVGFSFGALLEGVAGFGAPVAITSSVLVGLGFDAVDALVFTLIFNTAPVAFGALGTPITVLGQVTSLPDTALAAMTGRQLPVFGLLLPFYVVGMYSGWKGVKGVFPMLLVSGGSFGFTQFFVSNYSNYRLTDVMASLVSLLATIAFLKVWKPAPDPAFALAPTAMQTTSGSNAKGWIPWVISSGLVILWTIFSIPAIGAQAVQWPGLHNQVFITLYDKAYAAIWAFQPLASGTAILISAFVTAAILKVPMSQVARCAVLTWRQIRLAVLAVAAIVGLAYLMNYSGLNYTLGLGAASVGAALFPLLSPFLGWVAVVLSGSDTSGNALFGNLQVVAARQLNLSPVLMAATNSSGGVMSKMISPQNISTGAATIGLQGKEGVVFARTFKHSVILGLLLAAVVYLEQFVFPGIIPTP